VNDSADAEFACRDDCGGAADADVAAAAPAGAAEVHRSRIAGEREICGAARDALSGGSVGEVLPAERAATAHGDAWKQFVYAVANGRGGRGNHAGPGDDGGGRRSRNQRLRVSAVSQPGADAAANDDLESAAVSPAEFAAFCGDGGGFDSGGL